MSEQLSLLEWKPPAEIVPFPFHRSHGATAGVARAIMYLDTPKRTGRLNSIRAQTRKRMVDLVGAERAEQIADDLVRMIRIQIGYQEVHHPSPPKQKAPGTVISSLDSQRVQSQPHDLIVGKAGDVEGQGQKALAGCGAAPREHQEQVSARARDGGAA